MGKRVKVVLDTNVWVSILLNKTLAKDFLPLIESRRIDAYLSNQLLRELAKVLTYPKIEAVLDKAGTDPRIALSALLRSSKLLNAKRLVDVIKQDPADNRVLECAQSAKAEFVVSGDKHLLSLGHFSGIRIVAPREFLEIVKASRTKRRSTSSTLARSW